MLTWRASARPSASSRRTWGLAPAASSDTLLGLEKQWSKACTRASTRLPRCSHAFSKPSPYSSPGSARSTLRQTRSTVSTLTRVAPPSRQAAWTERTSPWSALDPASCSRSSTPCSGGPDLERGQQRPGGQLGARIGAQERSAALLAGGWVEALEHGPHLLGAGLAVQAGRGGGAAHEPAR